MNPSLQRRSARGLDGWVWGMAVFRVGVVFANLAWGWSELRKRAEEKVKQPLDELQRWRDVTLNREERVQELKREVSPLLRRLGEPPQYPSQAR